MACSQYTGSSDVTLTYTDDTETTPAQTKVFENISTTNVPNTAQTQPTASSMKSGNKLSHTR